MAPDNGVEGRRVALEPRIIGVELSRSVGDRRLPEGSWPASPPGSSAGRDDGGVAGGTGLTMVPLCSPSLHHGTVRLRRCHQIL